MNAWRLGLRDWFQSPKAWVPAFAGAVIATIAVFGLPALVRYATEAARPPDLWITLTSFEVADTVVGVAPIILASPTVHRSFLAETSVTLWKKTEGGGLVAVCAPFSRNHLVPNAQFPDPVTLDYWSKAPPNLPCVPEEPGVYVVTIWMGIQGNRGISTAPIDLVSNEFTVRAAQ